MAKVELTDYEMELVCDALQMNVARMRIQHRTVKVRGMGKDAHDAGVAWLERFGKTVDDLCKKIRESPR